MKKKRQTRRTNACNDATTREPVDMDLRKVDSFFSIESNGTVLEVTPSRNSVMDFVKELKRKGSNPQVYHVYKGKKVRIKWEGESR